MTNKLSDSVNILHTCSNLVVFQMEAIILIKSSLDIQWLTFMNIAKYVLTIFRQMVTSALLLPLLWYSLILKPHFWWIPEVWLCMSWSFLILRVHVSQSQYDKNLSLFMRNMCMLSWLVRWVGWPFEWGNCN